MKPKKRNGLKSLQKRLEDKAKAKGKEPPDLALWGRGKRLQGLNKKARALADLLMPRRERYPWELPDNAGPFYNYAAFGKRLEKRGFQRIGSGMCSQVYAKPNSDRVIKVTRDQDGWIDYCLWGAQKGYAGKFTPKVFSYKTFKGHDENSKFFVSVVERMSDTISGLDNANDNAVVGNLVEYGACGNDMAALLLEEVHPGLGSFTKELKGYSKELTDGRLDLHGHNVMVRKNGTVCVTDPIYQGTSKAPARLKSTDFAMAA